MLGFAHLQLWSLTTWAGVVLICYGLYLVLDALYNIFLHPLSKFPGPPSAAASHIPYVYAAVRGRLAYWVKSLHDQYDSPVVRISPRELSFIGADVWDDVYRKRDKVYDKDLAVYQKSPNGVASVLEADGHTHARMRKVLDHAFSDRAFREHEPVVDGYVNILIAQLHEQCQEGGGAAKVNVLNWYQWTAFDVIGDLTFGDKFGCLQNQKLHPWVASLCSVLEHIIYVAACNRFHLTKRILPLLIPKQVKQKLLYNWNLTAEKVGERIELGTDKPDFMSEILKFNDTKLGLSRQEIQSNAALFVLAGSDSIASILTGTTFHLLQNPAVMKKLTDEVLGAFKSEAEIDSQRVSKLPYLVACLDEVHRIYPAAMTGQAMVVPPGGLKVGNQWIPGGTGISSNLYAIFRSERNFKDPDTFVPERWLGDPRYASDNKDVFYPFSAGARNCIGKNIGTLELRLILAKMIWNFNIELCEKTDSNWTDQKVFVAFVKKPLTVKLSPRVRSAIS